MTAAKRLLTLLATGRVPVAGFTGTPLSLNSGIGETATFTDASDGSPTAWNYEYTTSGGGVWSSFGTTRNVTITSGLAPWDVPGVYDIRLTATNAAGINTKTRLGYLTIT